MSQAEQAQPQDNQPENKPADSQQQSVQPHLKGQLKAAVPDPEVVMVAQRRRFSAAYKRRILEEADGCDAPGQVGALLRREGLYSSHLTRWRQQRKAGKLDGLTGQKRGRKPDAQAKQVAQLQAENERLRAQLEQAELILDVQKKLSQLLGLKLNESLSSENE